ncbi:MAG: hypothetical protein U9N03_00745 [Candidatus Caldatribacteriota bacterium]|nr:hypothetical protein [Candidatus Caldatribacteriota bacterium]
MIHQTRFGSDKSDSWMMKKLPHLYSLSPWRVRVGVRGINLHAICNMQYDILMTDLIDELILLFLVLLDTQYPIYCPNR